MPRKGKYKTIQLDIFNFAMAFNIPKLNMSPATKPLQVQGQVMPPRQPESIFYGPPPPGTVKTGQGWLIPSKTGPPQLYTKLASDVKVSPTPRQPVR